MNPKQKLEALIKDTRRVAEKARDEGRNFTADEKRVVDANMAEIESLQDSIAAGEKSAATLSALDAMATGDYLNLPGGRDGNYLTFGKSWSAKASAGLGQKALATGSPVFVDTELTPTPIPIGRPATSLLNVLPTKQHNQPAYRYLRQSVRTNNAAVVAEGAVKPTSVYTIVPVDGSLSVLAHLSEAVPRYWFLDAVNLQPFVETELGYGLQLAVEAKVLADINATSGIQTQAFATSPLITLRKCLTKLEVNGFTPAGIVIHPTDWEGIELALASTTAVEYRGLPFDPVARRLYGVPIVVANVEAAGTSHVIANGAVGVDIDTSGIAVQWSENSNADDWSRNLVRARCEGRFGTSVYTPLGVVKAALA